MRGRSRATSNVWISGRDRTSTSALGAGAIATSTLGLDPAATPPRGMRFRRAFHNSIDAVSDRDFVQEFLADATICATHLSRLAADLARWTDPALGWAQLDEAYTTGSSMMPQKRNPDTAELARAKAARIVAGFVAAERPCSEGLPLGYHRDLQEDKEPVFDAADTLELVLPALVGAVDSIRFDARAMRAARRRRRALRDRSRRGAGARRRAVPRGASANGRAAEATRPGRAGARRDLSPDEWGSFGVADGASLLDPEVSVRARTTPGGPSPESVRQQADAVSAALAARVPTSGHTRP